MSLLLSPTNPPPFFLSLLPITFFLFLSLPSLNETLMNSAFTALFYLLSTFVSLQQTRRSILETSESKFWKGFHVSPIIWASTERA